MAEILEMPKLSDTMTEGVVAAWHKKVGEKVNAGELLAEIETDKATMELDSFWTGTLLWTAVGDKGSVVVGKLLAIIGKEGEDVKAILADYEAKKGGAKASVSASVSEEKSAGNNGAVVAAPVVEAPQTVALATSEDDRVKASPLAKSIAKAKGIDIGRVAGSGPEGRIVKKDVENYKESAAAASSGTGIPAMGLPTGKEGFTEVPLSQMRKTIARRLTESKNGAPHFYLTMEIDMGSVWEARQAINETAPIKVSFNDIVIKACAMALRQHPGVNASWRGESIRYNQHIHIGMAVAVPDGLIVPVIRYADNLGFSQIAGEAKRLADMARNKKLQPSDWEGNTFSISNLGMYGIEEFTAIINPPDACILAVGAIRDVPVVKNGVVVPGKTMKVTLSCDHRVVDGAVGSAFLKTLKEYLEQPMRMLI
jgi:pyruvate dehydrogenase E2 component (dihydrolipoamide acetyltransferase)